RLASMLSKFSLQTTRLQYERDLLLQQLTTRAQEMEDAKQEAEEANLAKSRFLAQASHDLRQPLHAIGLFVETISNDNLTPRVNNIVERVQTSLGALSKLFDSLLDITQLDTRKINRNDMNFALQEMFDQLQQDFRPIAREQQVELRFARTSVAIRSDVILFGRLLQNLISNAIRYAPGGRVLVGVRRGARYSIEVLDTGPGIAPEDQARIFQEFVRLEPKDQLLAPGLGLGLAIVQRVAGILTLRLDLDSTPSRGTRFAVRGLEPATGALSPIVEETRSTPAHTLEGARICVIDDDVEVLEATERLLSQWGCQVQTTDKLEDVEDTVDVVISDVELADGVNAFDVFGAQEPDFELVFISGNTSAELRERANAHHAPLLHKPVRPVQLRSALLHVLTRDANAGARDV
ncbi:MAG: hybrid sensor histidine kinase/response regulator, partial [Pseudomonadota bacterium]